MTALRDVEAVLVLVVVVGGDVECGPELQQCHNEVTQLHKLGSVFFTVRLIRLFMLFNCTGRCYLSV